MIELNEIISYLEQIASPDLAEDYDNVGLMVGNKDAKISKVLISLDTDEKTVEKALECGADLIISHHPLLFKPAKSITDQTSIGRIIYSLIQNGINLYAIHTNFDSASNGLGDYFLKTACCATACDCIDGEFPNGIGRIAKLDSALTLGQLIDVVKKGLNLSSVKFVGNENKLINTVSVCNGSGADMLFDAYSKGADVYITGELKYHHARYAYENDLCLIEVPHYEAEIIFCKYLADILKDKFSQKCEFLIYQNENPWKVK